MLLPKQATFACALMLLPRTAVDCVMVTLRVVVQPLASLMVHVQVPAGRLIAVALFCTGDVFQMKP